MTTKVTTTGQLAAIGGYKVRRQSIAWTADASGNVSEVLQIAGIDNNKFQGEILNARFIPGSGDDQPDDQYDVTLTDEDGVDILLGQGTDLSNSVRKMFAPAVESTDGTATGLVPLAVHSTLTLAVSGAGNAKKGTIVLYMR